MKKQLFTLLMLLSATIAMAQYRISTDNGTFSIQDLSNTNDYGTPYPKEKIFGHQISATRVSVKIEGVTYNPKLLVKNQGIEYTDFRDGNNSDATFASAAAVDSWFKQNTGFKTSAGGSADGVVSNVTLSGSELQFTGSNGGFNGDVDLSGLGGGIISITALNQIAATEQFYSLTTDDGDLPAGLYWVDTNGDVYQMNSDSQGSYQATRVYQGTGSNWSGDINSPNNSNNFVSPPYDDFSGYTGLKMYASTENISYSPNFGGNIKETGITIGVRINPENSEFAHAEIDGSRLFWHENSTGGNDNAPYINIDANDYVLIGRGDYLKTKMSQMPVRDNEGLINLVVQMNTVGNITYYLDGSTTPVNYIDIGEYSDNLGDYIIQAWASHPTKVFAPKIDFKDLVIYEGLEDPSVVWTDLGITPKQSVPPTITVVDTSNGYSIPTNGTYTEEGATAVDYYGNDVTVDIKYMYRQNSKLYSSLDTSKVGKWFALYSATDVQGNVSEIQKEINVLPNDAAYGEVADYYISTSGNDSNDGLTEGTAWATPDKAITEIAALTGRSGTDTLIVEVSAGVYPRTTTLEVNVDRVKFRRKLNQEVTFSGGVEITNWSLVTDTDTRYNDLPIASRGKVYKADISSLSSSFGTIKVEGSKTIMDNNLMALYVDDKYKNIARYPDASNYGKRKYYWTGDIVPGGFTVKDPINSFGSRGTTNNPILFGGYVGPYWTYQINKVESVANDILQFSSGSPSYGSDNHHPIFFYNMLEELTEEGEWFLDRDSGIVYYYPEKDLSLSHVYVSTLQDELVRTSGTGITFEGINLKYSQDNLLELDGTNNTFKNASLIGSGLFAATIENESNGIDNAEIAHTAQGGVMFDGGGDINTLTASNNYLTNSHLHHLGNYIWTFQEAIVINTSGGEDGVVGSVVSNNHIHDIPGGVYKYGGNNNVFQQNDIHNAMQKASDYAVIYAFQRFDQLGNEIDTNYIHDIYPELQERHGVYAIYMDEQQAGGIITNNIFSNMPTVYAINHRSGNYVTVENNVFDNVKAAYRLDAGALSQPRSTMLNHLLDKPIDTAPWNVQYPWISSYPRTVAEIEASEFIYPIGTSVQDNIYYEAQSFYTPYSISATTTGKFTTNTNNNEINESPFIDPSTFNYNIKPSILSANNINAIDFNLIGIQ